jgi:hypothetical protein
MEVIIILGSFGLDWIRIQDSDSNLDPDPKRTAGQIQNKRIQIRNTVYKAGKSLFLC